MQHFSRMFHARNLETFTAIEEPILIEERSAETGNEREDEEGLGKDPISRDSIWTLLLQSRKNSCRLVLGTSYTTL